MLQSLMQQILWAMLGGLKGGRSLPSFLKEGWYGVDGCQKTRKAPKNVYKTLVNDGVNYQPQLVRRISEPSTVPRVRCNQTKYRVGG